MIYCRPWGYCQLLRLCLIVGRWSVIGRIDRIAHRYIPYIFGIYKKTARFLLAGKGCFHFSYHPSFPMADWLQHYFISICLFGFLASSSESFGSSIFRTPCSTDAAIFSLSTLSGRIIVCWNLEYENSRRR